MNWLRKIAVTGGMFCLLSGLAGGAWAASLPISELKTVLVRQPSGDDAQKFTDHVHSLYKKQSLAEGISPIVKEITTGWMIEAPGAKNPPRVTSTDGQFHLTLDKIGTTDLYAAVVTLPDKSGFNYTYEVDGKSLKSGGLEVYLTPEEFTVQPNVPHGTLTEQTPWKSSIFEGTTRKWWVYVPAQYKPEQPACVMIFQDGEWYKGYVPTVLDNMIASGDMPVTVAIFINPGNIDKGGSNRNFEYDTLSDQYARFLMDEILPDVEKTTKLRHDGASRALAGVSSGGICSWTAAWNRPSEFSKVLTWVGSYVNLAPDPKGGTGHAAHGGQDYPSMIRLTDRKPIRIFLQDGENDIDNEWGNWPLSAQQMVKALAFKGYDYHFEYGHGFHSSNHGQAILPDSLRWLWRGYKP